MIDQLFPPVPEADASERAARKHGLTALRAAVAAEQPARRRRRRFWLAPIALAAAAALIIALTSGVNEGQINPPQSPAAMLLTRAANAAAHGGATGPLGSGQVFYVRRVVLQVHHRTGYTYYVRDVLEDWVARDGSGRYRGYPIAPSFPTAADRAAWVKAGSPKLGAAPDREQGVRAADAHTFPPREGSSAISYAQVRALSTDPARLQSQLRTLARGAASPAGDAGVLERAGALLAAAPLEPAQRAALFHVAAGLAGVRISTDALDKFGQRGTAVRLDASANGLNFTMTMLVDPTTGTVLGLRTVVKDRSGRTLSDYSATFTAKVVPA